MEPNSMPGGGIYSSVQPGSMLGLEMSIHHHRPLHPHLLQNPNHHHNQILNFAHDDENRPNPLSGNPKNQPFPLSDDEDPAFAAEGSADDGKKKPTPPWQRMKWTDNMVRLLIMVVFYIGDEVVSEANNNDANAGSKKKGGGAAAGGGALQKKGKWKSVSRAMMERGFYVSPQQCEDKFNDLNKRYKRVNDIIGKGISCRVVENQSLLETMDHISPKLKDEVKKLLNSKHLFFREMCAYHTSCGHGGASGAGAAGGCPAETMPPGSATLQPPQGCLHSGNDVPNLNRGENENEDDNAHSDENADSDADSDSDDHEDTNFLDNERPSSRKRVRRGLDHGPSSSPSIQQLDIETMSVLQDPSRGPSEKRRWMKTKLVRLEEEKVGIQTRTFEIKKQRLKWLKFSGKKEREIERERLANERLRLENERMVLIVRQKELDLIEQQQQQHSSNRKSDPSSVTA